MSLDDMTGVDKIVKDLWDLELAESICDNVDAYRRHCDVEPWVAEIVMKWEEERQRKRDSIVITYSLIDGESAHQALHRHIMTLDRAMIEVIVRRMPAGLMRSDLRVVLNDRRRDSRESSDSVLG